MDSLMTIGKRPAKKKKIPKLKYLKEIRKDTKNAFNLNATVKGNKQKKKINKIKENAIYVAKQDI
jgi:hypothetical protein